MWSPVRSPNILRVAGLVTSIIGAFAGVEKSAWSQTPVVQAPPGAYAGPGDYAGSDEYAGTVDYATDTDPAAMAQFREPLQPYGSWVDDPTYGTVWVPSSNAVGNDFTPYVSGGHWALTADDQWTWVSDYSWGWGPFHYGRWVLINGRGWSWIPGSVYAPAWVTWRTGAYDQAYVGWAPTPPSWGWRGGVAVRLPQTNYNRYVYVPSRYAFQPTLRTYVAPPARARVIAPRMRPYVTAQARTHYYQPLAAARGPSPRLARVPAEAVPVHRVPYAARPVITVNRDRRNAPGYAAPPAHHDDHGGRNDRGDHDNHRR
jgi:hypothetical protein